MLQSHYAISRENPVVMNPVTLYRFWSLETLPTLDLLTNLDYLSEAFKGGRVRNRSLFSGAFQLFLVLISYSNCTAKNSMRENNYQGKRLCKIHTNRNKLPYSAPCVCLCSVNITKKHAHTFVFPAPTCLQNALGNWNNFNKTLSDLLITVLCKATTILYAKYVAKNCRNMLNCQKYIMTDQNVSCRFFWKQTWLLKELFGCVFMESECKINKHIAIEIKVLTQEAVETY